jgi:uncharacterized protein (TIGR00369 family)
MPNADELRRIFDAAPFIRDLGLQLVDYGEGRCETRLELVERHLQQDGLAHAGVQATIADHTAGSAAATLIGIDQMVLTVEFKINLLRGADGHRLHCKAAVLKPGSRLSVVESEVYCEKLGSKELVSKALVSLMIMDKRSFRS